MKSKTEQKEYSRQYYLKNKEKIKAYVSEWCRTLPADKKKRRLDKANAAKRARRAKNHAKEILYNSRHDAVRSGYSPLMMKEEEIAALLDSRPSHCMNPFCNKKLVRPDYVVDHDHYTGEALAIVCRRCNIIKGYKDSTPEIFRFIADNDKNWLKNKEVKDV